MAAKDSGTDRSHDLISLRLLVETLVIYAALVVASIRIGLDASPALRLLVIPILLLQGVWLDRIYTVSHEGVHRKLFPRWLLLNDVVSSVLLWPIAAPFSLFRRIHFFHHGQNRRDPATAALDTFVLRQPPTVLRRLYYRGAWIFCVFLGGFFVHTLVSFVLFLFVPTAVAQRISPVFRGYTRRARLRAFAELVAAIGFHLLLVRWLGARAWLFGFGLPLIPFAWVFSLLLYIYHYRVSFGPDVRHNVRSLPPHPLFSWLLLHFNEHATHHHDPSLPWYRLPQQRCELPPDLARNNNVDSLWQAIAQLRHGPLLYAESDGRLQPVDPPPHPEER